MRDRDDRRAAVVTWIVLAGVLAGAAIAVPGLWHSTVPGNLHDPSLRASDYFSASELKRGRDFSSFLRINSLLAQVVLIAVLVVFARRGAALARESAAGRIGTGFLLGMLGFAFVWISQLPFGVAQLWWERRHHLSSVGYVAFAIGNWLALGGRFLFIVLALLIVMGLAGPMRRLWWIPAAPIFVGLAVLAAFLSPYLAGDLRDVSGPVLRAEAHRIAQAEGVGSVGVSVQDVHQFTSAPNAEAAGLGSTRRVILWDTLFDGRFSRSEVLNVLAHEYGHLAHNHLVKRLGWDALFALPFALIIALATRRRGGMHEAAAVPVALLALVLVNLALTPLRNVISRRMESEADWAALQTLHDPASARLLFTHLGAISRDDPDPPGWSNILLGDHPPLLERIGQTLAWQAARKPAH
jgi:STE24 endopeptidase